MLKQATVLPALGAADTFHARCIHQVGHRCAGETVAGFRSSRIGSELQREPQTRETIHQPLTGLAVGLLALSWRIRPDQGVGESSGVEHRPTATGSSHQAEAAATGQIIPVVWPMALMASQREPGSIPAVKAQHRAVASLQQQGIQGHLGVTICSLGGKQAPGCGHAG